MVYVKKKTHKSEIEQTKEKARDLYASGFTTREVGKIVKKSRTWVADVVKEGNNSK